MYMTNQDRNIRTLIACFVIALVALVPLRIVESQNLMAEDAMVLGEETFNEEQELYLEEDYVEEEEFYEEEMVSGEDTEMVGKKVIEEEIELPNAELE